MKTVICKQERALKGRILSYMVLVFSVLYLLVVSEPFLPRIILFSVSLFVFGFSTSFKISSAFDNEKLYCFFGITLFTTKLDIEFPDYISVFSTSLTSDNEWGAIAAIGTKERLDRFVVRFFTANKNFTLYRTSKQKIAQQKAESLSKLLNVELYDTTKE
ncbi:hypothetical protein [Aquimarina celericrescens]|uniref:YcxB-like protein domain-containing protein n=1 Tax=Aquimarina celericrescens TaxID=1964542 RepID=A0ABW5AVV6_9FLAO|nr:hypothetical protein [Aquimarina celericrescens]